MHPAVHGLVSVVVAAFVGFSLAFLLLPDPTGMLPVTTGLVLTAVGSPLFYRHLRGTNGR